MDHPRLRFINKHAALQRLIRGGTHVVAARAQLRQAACKQLINSMIMKRLQDCDGDEFR